MNTHRMIRGQAGGTLAILLSGSCARIPPSPTQNASDRPLATALVPAVTSAEIRGLPRYNEPELAVDLPSTGASEGKPNIGDINGDGLGDVIILSSTFQTFETYNVEILINEGGGSLSLESPGIFEGEIPVVQNPAQIIVADFNGDGMDDFFVADHGYDLPPHPGFQNILVLTLPDGNLSNATPTLPQQSDFTHSACTGDVDNDGDLDIYVGNIWGENDIDPILLLNDGSGGFSQATDSLPPHLRLPQNAYTACEFADVDNDGALDLVLGDAGDDLDHDFSTPSSEVLLNDGSGRFEVLPNAMPEKDYARSDICHDIVTADLNGDDAVDLFIVYERQPEMGSYIQALVNNGDGTFSDQTEWIIDEVPQRVWADRMEMRDIDHDGDLDLVASVWDAADPDPLIFLNDDSGFFTCVDVDFNIPYLYYSFISLGVEDTNDIIFWADDIYIMREQ